MIHTNHPCHPYNSYLRPKEFPEKGLKSTKAFLEVIKKNNFDDYQFEILDGNHRYAAVKELVEEAIDTRNKSLLDKLKGFRCVVYKDLTHHESFLLSSRANETTRTVAETSHFSQMLTVAHKQLWRFCLKRKYESKNSEVRKRYSVVANKYETFNGYDFHDKQGKGIMSVRPDRGIWKDNVAATFKSANPDRTFEVCIYPMVVWRNDCYQELKKILEEESIIEVLHFRFQYSLCILKDQRIF